MKAREPYMNGRVPDSAILAFCLRNKILMQNLHDTFAEYLNTSKNWSLTKTQRKKLSRKFDTCGYVTAFKALIKLEFNYMDNTLIAGTVTLRFIKVFRYDYLNIKSWF